MTPIFEQPMKFRVKDEYDSNRIQRALFAKGASWYSGKTTNHTESECLFVSRNGSLTHAYRDRNGFFDNHDNEEYIVTEHGDIVPAVQPDKVVEFDGKKYSVPGYTKFMTRDDANSSVFAWENKPEWKGAGKGGFNDMSSNNRRIRVYEYVEPMPEGAMIMEVM